MTNGIANVMTKVTVSWSRLTGGDKGMLISATSDPSFGWVDENLYVTHHHNYFTGVFDRTPRVRFAKVHTFNNFAESWGGYAVGASTLAEVLVENNVFDASVTDRACRVDCLGADCTFHGGVGGAVRASGNLLDQGSILAACDTASPSTVLDEFPGA